MLTRAEFPLREELLGRYPVLRSLPEAEFERLLAEGALRRAPAGTVLFDESQPCTGFPFVLQGAVGVSKYGEGGREIQLYRVEAGDSCVLSSSCLLGSVAYNAHGVAIEDTALFVLPVPTFQRLLGSSQAFRGYVFSLFAGRMADLMQTVDEVAFKRLDERLARLLLRRGPRIHATHQQLADELGSVREIVSRIIRGFAEQGLVRTGREQIEVLDRAGLARIAGLEA